MPLASASFRWGSCIVDGDGDGIAVAGFDLNSQSIIGLREKLFPFELSLDSWKSLCAIKLSDPEFTPKEILVYLDLAVVVAKGRTSLILGGDVTKGVVIEEQ